MLNTFAQRLHQSPRLRHLFFLALTAFTIVFVGYLFGTGDHVVHLPFLNKTIDASLYPNDPYLEMRHQHYTYFWRLFIPFAQAGVLEVAVFAVHVLVTYGAFWALWALADELFHNPLASMLGTAALAFPHIGFAGWPVFEFSLLPRTFVFPFLLIALILFLRRRTVWAFALMGVLYNLHVVSVNFALGMVMLDCVLEWRRVGLRQIALGLAAFVVCALPVLLWRGSQSHLDLSLRPEWLSIVARGTLYNLFHLIGPMPHILLATFSGLSVLVLFVIAWREAADLAHSRTIAIFMVAVVLILAAQTISAEWLPVTFIVQMQIIRAGVFAIVFGNLYFAYYLARRYQSGALAEWDFRLLAAALVGATLEFVVLAVWAIHRWIKSVTARRGLSLAAQVGLMALTVTVAIRFDVWSPGIRIFAERTPFYEAQIWARDNTPKDAVFIVPPERWWIYETEWRVFSQRSTTPQIADLLMVAFVPEYLDIWTPGFEQVAPGAAAQFKGDWYENWAIGARAFYGLSDAALLGIASDWRASYLVVNIVQSPARPWPVCYENRQYRIYKIGTGVCQ